MIDVAGRNPHFNASGCADPTAYEALKPIIKEDARVGGQGWTLGFARQTWVRYKQRRRAN